jgi:hypothetical protein
MTGKDLSILMQQVGLRISMGVLAKKNIQTSAGNRALVAQSHGCYNICQLST